MPSLRAVASMGAGVDLVQSVTMCNATVSITAMPPEPILPHPCFLSPSYPQMPSLRAVASMGAGVDHAMGPGLLPPGVEVVRIVSIFVGGVGRLKVTVPDRMPHTWGFPGGRGKHSTVVHTRTAPILAREENDRVGWALGREVPGAPACCHPVWVSYAS